MKLKNKLTLLGVTLTLLFTLQAAAKQSTEKAILAGGCFWGMEEVFRRVPGVISTQVGYTGGSLKILHTKM